MSTTDALQSFINKKQLISKMITQQHLIDGRQYLKHFGSISEPISIQTETNAVYLDHIKHQFKDQLRQFVHQKQSFKEAIFQLVSLAQSQQNQKIQSQKASKVLRTRLNEVELDNQIMSDKNNIYLSKILSLEQQAKNLKLLGEEYEREATRLEEDTQYEKCLSEQIKSNNTQFIDKLEHKALDIWQGTVAMEATEKQIHKKQSAIKNYCQNIQSLYYTLESQDFQLADRCSDIEQGLNIQNKHINNIQFLQNNLQQVFAEKANVEKKVKSFQEIKNKLLNYEDDLIWNLNRTNQELSLENSAIDQELWKINQEQLRLQSNQQQLKELQLYVQDLIRQNQLLQNSLEQHIIEDHSIKKIVDSKCSQPVGKKTKIFLQNYQEKTPISTSSSEGKQNSQLLQQSQKTVKSSQKRETASSIDKMACKGPKKLQFIFSRFAKTDQKKLSISGMSKIMESVVLN